jgi:hypothetical protein
LPSPGVASERTVTIDGKAAKNPSPLVERWIEDQREWQKTAMAYLDSMVKNDDFLVHLGNAMRGSLLAGKPYPTAPASPPAQEPPADDRLDRVLFALHEMQGQLNDLRLTLDELRHGGKGSPSSMPATRPASAKKRAPRAKAKLRKPAAKPRKAARSRKAGKARG